MVMGPLSPGLQGAVLALLVSACTLWVGRAFGRGWTFTPAAVGLGYVAGHAAVVGLPTGPPAQAVEWLLPIALVAMASGIADAAFRLPKAVRWLLRLTATAAMLGATLRPLMLSTWESRETVAWLIGLGVAAVASWTNLDALADRLPGASQPCCLAVLSGIGAGTVFASGSFVLGGLGMVLMGALAPVALLTLRAPPNAEQRGLAAATSPVLVAIGVEGLVFAELPRISAGLLLLATGAAWIGTTGALRRVGPRKIALICALATAVCAGMALAWAVVASPRLESHARMTPDGGRVCYNARGADAERCRMCELMGMSFEGPVAADFSIREFALRGEENADGWGLGWYADRSLAVVKEPVKWCESGYAGFLEDYPAVRSRIYVAHVRHKTVGGEPNRADTHPFAREHGGREYCFAHNGTIDDYHGLPLTRFRPIGRTDSEHVFCHLLGEVASHGVRLTAEEGWRWLHSKLATLNRKGKLNVLLTDGERLFVYHDLGGWKGLHFRLVRLRGLGVKRFEDHDLAVALDGSAVNRGIVVATRPLSPTGWHAIRTGELIVLEGGAVRFSSERARHVPEFVPTPVDLHA